MKIMKVLSNFSILIIFFLFSIIASVIAGDIIDLPLFLAAIFCGYLIPGLAIQKFFKTLQYEDYNIIVFSSFALGYCLSILIYLVLLISGYPQFALYTTIIVTVISLCYIRRDLVKILCCEARNTAFLTIVLSLCYIVACVAFQFSCLSPEVASEQQLHPDVMFWFRNTVAATMSYPLKDLSVFGNDFYYHYFSSIGLANLKFITGIELFDLCFTYSYIIYIFLLVGSVYIISSELISSKRYFYIAVLTILFTTTYEPITLTYYSPHLYCRSFGFTEGFSLTLFAYYYYRRYKETGRKAISIILPLLVFCVSVGTKGPLSLILLLGILFESSLELFNRKNIKNNTLVVCLYCTTFLLFMFLFVIDIKPEFLGQEGDGLSLSGKTIFKSGYFTNFCRYLNNVYPILPFYALLSFLLFIILNSFISLSWAIVAVNKYREINWKKTRLELVAMTLIGYLLFLLFDQTGSSQVYFYFITIPFGLLYLIGVIDNNVTKLKKWDKTMLAVASIVGFVFFSYSIFKYVSDNVNTPQKMELSGNYINKQELEALRWVRNHIEKDAVILSNKIQLKDGKRSYVVSCYTERQSYMEGYKYSVSLKDPVISQRHKMVVDFFESQGSNSECLKNDGVNYVIYFKDVPQKEPKINGMVIFENKAAKVIKL